MFLALGPETTEIPLMRTNRAIYAYPALAAPYGRTSTVADIYGELGAAVAVAQIRKEGDLSVNTTVLLEALALAHAEIEKLKALSKSLAASQDWRPISEAPTAGTRLELWTGTIAVYGRFWSAYNGSPDPHWVADCGWTFEPTHFRFPSSGPQVC